MMPSCITIRQFTFINRPKMFSVSNKTNMRYIKMQLKYMSPLTKCFKSCILFKPLFTFPSHKWYESIKSFGKTFVCLK